MSVEPAQKPTLSRALVVVGGLLAAMWAIEVVDVLTLNSLDYFGIEPRQTEDLLNIPVAADKVWDKLTRKMQKQIIDKKIEPARLTPGAVVHTDGTVTYPEEAPRA